MEMDFSHDNDFILPPQTGPLDPHALGVAVGTGHDAGVRCIAALRSVVRPICGRAAISNLDTGKTTRLTRKRLAEWWDSGIEASLNDFSFVQLDALLDETRLLLSFDVRDDVVRFEAQLMNSPDLPAHSRVLESFADAFVRAADAAQAWTSHSLTPPAISQPAGDEFRPECYVYSLYVRPRYPGLSDLPEEPSLRLYIGTPLLEALLSRDAAVVDRLLDAPGWVSLRDLDDEVVEFLNPLLLSYKGGPNCTPLYASRAAWEASLDGPTSTDDGWTDEAAPAGTKFYKNITLVGADATVLLTWLRERGSEAQVEISELGIVVFDADADQWSNHDDLARAMSELLDCIAIVVENHDDDLLRLEVFDKGHHVDSYNSSPELFAEETSDLEVPTGGHRLAALFGVDEHATEEILRSGYVEEHHRHEDLITLLGLPIAAVWYEFASFTNGTAPEPSSPRASFVRIP